MGIDPTEFKECIIGLFPRLEDGTSSAWSRGSITALFPRLEDGTPFVPLVLLVLVTEGRVVEGAGGGLPSVGGGPFAPRFVGCRHHQAANASPLR
mgnify:CR=1 FL=1